MKTSFKEKLKIALRLAVIFFKIGLFSFGGGYAMFSMIEREIVEKHKFLTHSELMDVFAIAESTPGAVAVNVATFVGTKRAGVIGGILATFGLMLPSIVIIMALSYVINEFRDNKWVGYLFKGIRAGVLVLISKAVISFYRNMRKDWFDFVLLIGAFCIAFLTDVSVIYIILGTIVICIFIILARNVKMKRIGATTKDIYVRETRDGVIDSNVDTTTDSDDNADNIVDAVQIDHTTADKEDAQ